MKKHVINTLLATVTVCLYVINANAQNKFSSKHFFTDTSILKATLVTDMGNLTSGRIGDKKQSGSFTLFADDSTKITSKVQLNARGHMRRETCYIPPLKVQFSVDSTSPLSTLKSLKIVAPCEFVTLYQELLIREYLAYKMYNLLTDLSFRVRLISLEIQDSKGKKKTLKSYAFFIEDIDQLAKRNHSVALDNIKINTETTDRQLVTLLSIFQYMIGNTDWSVPGNHNIRLIHNKDSSMARPVAIPYDFDYSGLVNAPYAVPDPMLNIESVTDRVYRGYPRNMSELEPIIQKFKDKKTAIYDLVNNCNQLTDSGKKYMLKFLDQFFDIISNPRDIQVEFIDKARQMGEI